MKHVDAAWRAANTGISPADAYSLVWYADMCRSLFGLVTYAACATTMAIDEILSGQGSFREVQLYLKFSLSDNLEGGPERPAGSKVCPHKLRTVISYRTWNGKI